MLPPVRTKPQRLQTPSLQHQSLQCLHRPSDEDGFARSYVSTARLVTASSLIRRQHLVSRQRTPAMVTSFVDRLALTEARTDLHMVVQQCRDFKNLGRGTELLQLRRLRGIDCLYNHIPEIGSKAAHLHASEDGVLDFESLEGEHSEESLSVARAAALLRNAKFFKVIEAATPGIIQRLAAAAHFQKEIRGQVLFRQGDPPANCYVIFQGHVGVRVFKPKPKAPAAEAGSDAHRRTNLAGNSGSNFRSAPPTEEHEHDRQPTPRDLIASNYTTLSESCELIDGVLMKESAESIYRTSEGFNTFTQASEMGVEVLKLGPGSLFGELALQKDLPRAASIVCTDDCEFLVVARETYQQVLQAAVEASNKARRAFEILTQSAYFQEMEGESPGLNTKLASTVKYSVEAAGQVIFRQGDPPGDCYIVLSGSIAVLVNKGDNQKSLPTHRGEHVSDRLSTWTSYVEHTKTKSLDREKILIKHANMLSKAAMLGPVEFATAQEAVEAERTKCSQVLSQPKATVGCYAEGRLSLKKTRASTMSNQMMQDMLRFRTSEGFSSFTEASKLGDQVVVLGKGVVFGELALRNNKPRAATIRCLEECEFLVIGKDMFTQILAEVNAKLRYLDEHVPGMKQLGYKLNRPSALFTDRSFPAGHCFFYEGITASSAELFILRKGTIEFRRYRSNTDNPAYVLSHRPLETTSWHSFCERPRTGVAGSQAGLSMNRTGSRGPTGGSANQGGRGLIIGPSPPASRAGRQVVYDTIRQDTSFSSLLFFPMLCPEPFTVVAVTPVEVYHCGSMQSEQLAPTMKKTIRNHLLSDLRHRVRNLAERLDEFQLVFDFELENPRGPEAPQKALSLKDKMMHAVKTTKALSAMGGRAMLTLEPTQHLAIEQHWG